MNRFALLLFCSICCLLTTAQSQNVQKFFDINHHPCAVGDARYVAVIKKTDSGYYQESFYLPGNQLEMKGLFMDSGCTIKNGRFYYLYPGNSLHSFGTYRNNNKEGLWLSYHPNKVIADSTMYEQGEPTGIAMRWHSNGIPADSINYTLPNPVEITWHDNGYISSAGRLDKQGHLVGKWQFFHNNGKLSALESYDASGQLLDKTYYDENGVQQTDTTDKSHPATFKNGISGWANYMTKSTYWPRGYRLANTNTVTIGVSFTVNENGDVTDILLYCPFDPVFDDIVRKAFTTSPKWVPAIMHNRKVSFQHRQTVTFHDRED
jgi:antitoxin component YwqK of YwqJK toxin-antitoxin module